MKGYWEDLSPNNKRYLAIGLGIAILFGLVAIFSDSSPTEPSANRAESIRHILTDTNTREIGIDSLAADLKLAKDKSAALQREVDQLKNEFARSGNKTAADKTLIFNVEQLMTDVRDLKGENFNLSKKLLEAQTMRQSPNVFAPMPPPETDSTNQNETGEDDQESSVVTNPNLANPDDFFRYAPTPSQASSMGEESTGRGQGAGAEKPPSLVISSYVSTSPGIAVDPILEEPEIYLSGGAIITGVLINGMDAPTGKGARQDPFPATIRVQKEAILPNRFTADVRECFILVSGYGDLSSERAYMRGETLSCIKNNGDAIEQPLDAYLVGEDGKAGIRGRLVSKQGQLIARSLMAGFLGGAAEAFDVDSVPTLSLGNEGNRQLQQNEFSSTLARGAAAKGASNALDRIAQFYIEMAEAIFPVIEIDAGRQVDIFVTKGSTLTTRASAKTE
jgi:conjugal transfer pilus assembly protein TraB